MRVFEGHSSTQFSSKPIGKFSNLIREKYPGLVLLKNFIGGEMSILCMSATYMLLPDINGAWLFLKVQFDKENVIVDSRNALSRNFQITLVFGYL